MERRIFVVVLRHAPLDGFAGARAREELGEGFHLRPPVVQEPVVEHAQVPHLCRAARLRPLLIGRGRNAVEVPWFGVSGGGGGGGNQTQRRKDYEKGETYEKTPEHHGPVKVSALCISWAWAGPSQQNGLGLHKRKVLFTAFHYRSCHVFNPDVQNQNSFNPKI